MCLHVLKNLLHTQRILCGNYAKTTYSQLKLIKQFSSNVDSKYVSKDNNVRRSDNHNLAGAINEKYKLFSDQNADIILDVSEEQQKISLEELRIQKEIHDSYTDINLNRKHKLKATYNAIIKAII